MMETQTAVSLVQFSRDSFSADEDVDGEGSVQTEEESEDMSKSSRVTVHFEDEETTVDICACDFKFIEFDSWVRSRFGLAPLTKLKYCYQNRIEIFLTMRIFCKEELRLLVLRADSLQTKETPHQQQSEKTSKSFQSTFWLWWNSRSFLYFTVTVLVALLGVFAQHIPLTLLQLGGERFKSLPSLLEDLDGMLFPDQWPVRKGTVTDAVIAFITWSTTYLFVRRLFNPETMSVAIERFSSDAFYGGLAAAAASIFKSVLYVLLSPHSH